MQEAAERHWHTIRQEMRDAEDPLARIPSGKTVIELRDVYLRFGTLQVLDGVTLDVRKGETLMIVGESGSGKSTILKLVLRLLRPDAGAIRVFDQDIVDLPYQEALALRSHIGMVFQNAALFDSMTIFENVAYPLREHRAHLPESEIEDIVRERLEFVDLDPGEVSEKLPSQLSGGMRKRVGIARAIATDPEVVLYDEPTAGLDPLTVGTITELIRKLQRELGVTSVVVTHDIRAGFRVASRVNLLRDGKIVFQGPPEDMLADRDDYIQAYLRT